MSGINYDLSKIKGFVFDVDGVLSPATVPMGENGDPLRMVNIKDGYALQLCARLGYPIAIITGGKTESVRKRYEALGIKDIFLGASRKIEVLEKWLLEKGVKPESILYMGDDIPDLQCMQSVGLPCCPADAAVEIRDSSTYISGRDGGYGCARDVIEQVLRAKGDWIKDEKAFGW